MVVQTIIEIPQGSQNKYEYDVVSGRIRLDRVLYGSMHYPANYGFAVNTWADDHDPLDVIAYCSTPIDPGIEVDVRIIGVLMMEDEHGPDAKIVGVVDKDPRWQSVTTIDKVEPHLLKELREFFQTYKTLQGIHVEVGGFQDAEYGRLLVERCQEQFRVREVNGEITHA